MQENAARLASGRSAVSAGEPEEWQRPRPRTLVDQAVEAIVAAAARGLILPGDRIVETEVARALGISRVPVREALRLLESQGVVTSTPYRGIRLMEVSPERIEQVVDVRLALEVRAAVAAIRLGRHRDGAIGDLERALEALSRMAAGRDAYGLAAADTTFHRTLCRLGGNQVLCMLWESLARQLTVIVGLSTLGKSMRRIIAEHQMLLETFRRGDPAELERGLEEHIGWQNREVDYQRLVAERRGQQRPEAAL
jgi:DNA-binding GntR family transcriptional regulator